METREGSLIKVRFIPSGTEIRVASETTVMEATREAGLSLGEACESDLLCGLCKVQILDGLDRLSPPENDETRVLAALGCNGNERLACRARISGPVTVTAEYW